MYRTSEAAAFFAFGLYLVFIRPKKALFWHLSGDAFDVFLHAICAVLFHAIGDMTIHIQRKRSRKVTEIFLHGFHVVPVLDGCHSVSMAQIMKASLWHPDF